MSDSESRSPPALPGTRGPAHSTACQCPCLAGSVAARIPLCQPNPPSRCRLGWSLDKDVLKATCHWQQPPDWHTLCQPHRSPQPQAA
eukprot:1790597-Rhodomonas_salina.2